MPGSTTRIRGAGGKFASSKGFFSTNTLQRGLAQFELKMRDHIEEIAQDFAHELVDYAQAHAPWSDRTGDARAGLDAVVEAARGGDILVTLFHTVDYGVWLEVRWGGRYAIIIPTVERKGPELLAKMQHMMNRIVFYE
jgi:hypothetical protein